MDPETLGRKLIGSEDERAVSPVIGVILMVAITVILAAVIAAFVLDIGDTGEPVQANIDVSVDDTGDDTEVTLTVTDATNVDNFILTESDGGCGDGSEDSEFSTNDDRLDNLNSVGDTDTAEDCGDGGDLIIVGEVDGSEQIVVDTTI